MKLSNIMIDDLLRVARGTCHNIFFTKINNKKGNFEINKC